MTDLGIQFSLDASGKRATTEVGKKIIAAALAPLSVQASQNASQEKNWRKQYPKHIYALVEQALPSAEKAVASAQAGLDEAWRQLSWVNLDGQELSLHAARQNALARTPSSVQFDRHEIHGTVDGRPKPWAIPYRGKMLSGDALKRQLDLWVQRGIIEPSAAQALKLCADRADWFDLSDRHLVLLGAASEAGPLNWLCRWRANLIAIDRARPDVWQRIIRTVEQGNGRLIMPIAPDASGHNLPGADLLSDTPQLAAWLANFDKPLDLASLAYLDGERHVRVSLAMDWLAQTVLEQHSQSTLAYMATPTDVFAVSPEAAEQTRLAFTRRSARNQFLQKFLNKATQRDFFRSNIDLPGQGKVSPGAPRYGITDCLILEQGPNYALAKRLQQWRATVARAQGRRVSLNVAPSTTTTSVLNNRAIRTGFAGADRFGIEVFSPETTNAICAALWVHDLRNDHSAANPAKALAHPFELFMENACHGGMWRCIYRPRSALVFAAGLGWVRQKLGRA